MTFGERVVILRAITLTEKLDSINEMILSAVGNPFMSEKGIEKIKRSRKMEIDSLIRRHNELKD